MKDQNWQMYRAGIMNFWYYEDQEFQLEQGRMILRGSNGSGKSVTMQSILPLVLDGDKRPHRLDPFGSRDRKIEYYLLGDQGNSHHERTGYLWLEFYHPTHQIYKTIGIGLRAKLGATKIGFWGFVLTDGRRINKDFWLYRRSEWENSGSKHPLSRKELEEQIGNGGQVVQDQVSYRNLVNKHLFGFRDESSYQELLQLMLELRSPKLSKDFKPSTMYGILNRSLPSLSDEDLRPLSEMLEDLDQITDRLEEVQLHVSEFTRLQKEYEKYNQYFLLQKSQAYIDSYHSYQNTKRNWDSNKNQINEYKQQKSTLEREIQELEQQLQEVRIEIDLLEKHEAIEKEQELIQAKNRLAELGKYREQVQVRLARKKSQLNSEQKQLVDQRTKKEQKDQESVEVLQELEMIADEIEFTEHHIFHRRWMSGIPEDLSWHQPWQNQVKLFREQIQQVLRVLVEIENMESRYEDLESQKAQQEQKIADASRQIGELVERWEQEKIAWSNLVRGWKQSLTYLECPPEVISQLIEELGDPEDDPMTKQLEEKIRVLHSKQKDKLIIQQTQIQSEREQYLLHLESLEQQLEQWELSPDPHPVRSDAQIATRQARPVGSGASFYEVCEFREQIDEAQQALIESLLANMGILDAWIPVENGLSLQIGEEDRWVLLAPLRQGVTLWDYLQPTLPENSGLDNEKVEQILQSIPVFPSLPEAQEDSSVTMFLCLDGHYSTGLVVGRANARDWVEFVGAERRRQTRLREIYKLQHKVEEVKQSVHKCDEQYQQIQIVGEALIKEVQSFPSVDGFEQLRKEVEGLQKIRSIYQQDILLLEERLTLVKQELTRFKAQRTEVTSRWNRLKTKADFIHASEQISGYNQSLSQLAALWDHLQSLIRQEEQSESRLLSLEEDIFHEEDSESDYMEQIRDIQTTISVLEKLMKDLGLEEIHQKHHLLLEQEIQMEKGKQEKVRSSGKLEGTIDELIRNIEAQQLQVEQKHVALQSAKKSWIQEKEYALVEQVLLEDFIDAKDERTLILKQCKLISDQLTLRFTGRTEASVTNSLLQVFNASKNTLVDFALELIESEQKDRSFIQSRLDRNHPQTPSMLLQDLIQVEQQQQADLLQKDRELFERIILESVGKAIRLKIQRAEQWVRGMNQKMSERDTSTGLRLKLKWKPKASQTELQLDSEQLVQLLKKDARRLTDEEIHQLTSHFRAYLDFAKQEAQEAKESLRSQIYKVLDYRNWFEFELYYIKGDITSFRPLTDARFNRFSGGEKAMAMYIPLLAAMDSRYSEAQPDAPKIISLDEAFAGVDDDNIRDMFQLLTQMNFDYIMTSQVLWGCYDTVPALSIYEIYRPKDATFITLMHYIWNGRQKRYVEQEIEEFELVE